MNFCDDYGKCTQGLNCPVRTKKTIRLRDYFAAVSIGGVFAVMLTQGWMLK